MDHALSVLNWQENLLPNDLPPRWMWHLDHELERWFDAIKAERDRPMSSPSGEREAPMMINTLHPRNRGR